MKQVDTDEPRAVGAPGEGCSTGLEGRASAFANEVEVVSVLSGADFCYLAVPLSTAYFSPLQASPSPSVAPRVE